MRDDGPIFVRGVSRSGGTLMVTILDAHPDVAMSYELYPNLLMLEDASPAFLAGMIRKLEARATVQKLAEWIGKTEFKTFLMRLPRGGLDERDLLKLLREHVAADMGLRTSEERLRFVERCCLVKMRRSGKKRWGLKCTSHFSDYLALWPNAHFINMIRDGRDILASKLNTGNFNKDPARIGRSWAQTLRAFRQLVETSGLHAHPVIYEKLVTDSDSVVRNLCSRLGLEYAPDMLSFHAQDLTIFNANHLSGDRISKPIDTSRIGRWRKEVSPEQLESFYSTARDAMIAYGYLEDEHAH